MNQLRKNPLTGEWVVIGDKIGGKTSFSYQHCPFCPGQEEHTPSPIFETHRPDGSWQVRVVPDKFPVMRIEGELTKAGQGVLDWMNSIGAHEIIIEAPEHAVSMAGLSPEHIKAILQTWQYRISDLKKDPRFQYILIFQNQGSQTGVFTTHPYSQLLATPFIPTLVKNELKALKAYYDRKERCLLCDLLKQELALEKRVVLSNEDFVVITPFASSYSYELLILPRHHQYRFEVESESCMENLAAILKTTLQKLEKIFIAEPAFTLTLLTSPNECCEEANADQWTTIKEDFHWHIKITPLLSNISGLERGSGIHTNTVAPEDATIRLKDIVVE